MVAPSQMPEYRNAYMRQYRASHEAYRHQNIEYSRKRRLDNPDMSREGHLRRRYGITLEQKNAMVAAQGGKCAICKNLMALPHVDHDHRTGRLRGVLCANCNRGMGWLQEDELILLAAIQYLRVWRG